MITLFVHLKLILIQKKERNQIWSRNKTKEEKLLLMLISQTFVKQKQNIFSSSFFILYVNTLKKKRERSLNEYSLLFDQLSLFLCMSINCTSIK